MAKIALPQVTLCAVTSVNVLATVAAMRHSMELCDFQASILLTDQVLDPSPPGIEIRPIPHLSSAAAYSRYILRELLDQVATSHLLIVQWDGFVVRPDAWDPVFLEYDYIGAVWPQFDDGARVGNGGFSLRSKRLLEVCRSLGLENEHPEDVAICRTHRPRLERDFGMRFADPATAARFSYERTPRNGTEFGFHGVFNLPSETGPEGFWHTYRLLDNRRTVWPDFWRLLRSVLPHAGGVQRACRMLLDRFG